MKITNGSKALWRSTQTVLFAAMFALGATAGTVSAADMKLTLSGTHEVPAVKSDGTGTGSITVAPDGMISGSVKTTGIKGTAAHIHQAAIGKNGPVAIALIKEGDTYSVPKGSKLSPDQLKSFNAGDLYVNVHTASHPDGELRAQLTK